MSGELGSASEDKVLEQEEQETDEDVCTKPKKARKGGIDGAEAEQSKATRKSCRRPKRGAADGEDSQGERLISECPTHLRRGVLGGTRGSQLRATLSLNYSGVAVRVP